MYKKLTIVSKAISGGERDGKKCLYG